MASLSYKHMPKQSKKVVDICSIICYNIYIELRNKE